jgi:hypothetical protein
MKKITHSIRKYFLRPSNALILSYTTDVQGVVKGHYNMRPYDTKIGGKPIFAASKLGTVKDIQEGPRAAWDGSKYKRKDCIVLP